MQVYLDKDGAYRNRYTDKELIVTSDALRWFSMLDAAADEYGYAEFNDVPVQTLKRGVTAPTYRKVVGGIVWYAIPGSGNYIGDK